MNTSDKEKMERDAAQQRTSRDLTLALADETGRNFQVELDDFDHAAYEQALKLHPEVVQTFVQLATGKLSSEGYRREVAPHVRAMIETYYRLVQSSAR